MTDEVVSLAEAEALVWRALTVSNVDPDVAASVARALVSAEADGQKGHGLARVAAYAAQAYSGKVQGHAVPTLSARGEAMVDIDAGHGFAFPAIDLAIETLSELTPRTGIAAAAIRRSHHCGQLGAHVERLAERGLVALMVANSPKAMAPWGGRDAVFGTNPIAFAAPRADQPPLVIDLSLSHVARGKVMAAAKAGEDIPDNWALDSEGQPTTDAEAALTGTMLPAGGAKGAVLALMVEVLSAALVGANGSREASSFFDAEGDPPGVGQLLIAFKVAGVPERGFAAALEGLLESITGQGARLPGTRRLTARAQAEANGLSVSQPIRSEIDAILSARTP